jgi:hypothetical protein
MSDWMPVNPYPQDTVQHEQWGIAWAIGCDDGQRKLLDWQLEWKKNPNINIADVYSRLEQMREELK